MRGLSLILLVLTQPLLASYGNGNPRLERLFEAYLSPCCWQQSLAIHDSPTADKLREQIQLMVSEGRSDDQIKAALVQEHTKRILVIPEGPQSTWLFAAPWLMGMLGLSVLIFTVHRILNAKRDEPSSTIPPTDLDPALLDD